MTNYIRIAGVLAFCMLFSVGCQESTSSDSKKDVAPAASGAFSAEATAAKLSGDPIYVAIQSAIADPSILKRAERLSTILEGAGDEAVPAVRATVDRFRVDESAAEFGVLFYFWAEHDPAAAANWALTPGKARFKGSAMFTAFEAWGRQDPKSAVQGVYRAARETDEMSRLAQLGMIHGWFARDREELLRFIREQSIGVERQRALFGYVLSLVSLEGSEAAQKWAESLPEDDPRFKRAAFVQTSSALSTLDMPAAVAWCEVQCNTEWGRMLRRSLMRARLRQGDSPPEVLAWLGRMSNESAEDAEEYLLSLQVGYATWAHTGREDAVAWLESVIDTPEAPVWLPALFRYYASIKAVDDPNAALDFVKTRIETEQDRAYVAVAQRWKTIDPDAVAKWVETAPISEERKRQVRDYKYGVPKAE